MAQATKWYRKAAEQGDADAKEWLKKNAKDKSE
jgi:TPR repeat protein